jgi:hypothetical protein
MSSIRFLMDEDVYGAVTCFSPGRNGSTVDNLEFLSDW